MVMGLYDPLGMVSPALVHGKLLLRQLYGPQGARGWDADLPEPERQKWAKWFTALLVPAEAVFPRSTKPPDAVGLPRLAGFGDASMLAICAVLYVVWTDSQGKHHARVLTGKCRVAPFVWHDHSSRRASSIGGPPPSRRHGLRGLPIPVPEHQHVH